VKIRKRVNLRFFVLGIVFGLPFISIAAELHYPAYTMPLMIRPQDPVTTAMGLTGVAY